jgi:hypothetical protein
VFSAGSYGWGEVVVSVYPDSEKISAAPGVMFRRDDALHSWVERPKPALKSTTPRFGQRQPARARS